MSAATSIAPSRPVLRYHGGKWRLASWIICHFPSHRIYVEPFGGAASVLMRKDRVYSEVYNDRWDIVVNVFRVLRDPEKAAQLVRLLTLTPYSRTEFVECGLDQIVECNDVERARRTILRSFAGFGSAATNGRYATGFRANSSRSGTTPAHDWMHYPLVIEQFVERLRGVVIENRPAAQVIQCHDSPETLFYVDPPYLHSTRNFRRRNASYEFELTDEDHRELAALLHSVKGMVVISGYASDLYDRELYVGWRRVERKHICDGGRPRTEVLWINRAAVRCFHEKGAAQ